MFILNEKAITDALTCSAKQDPTRVRIILQKALTLVGLKVEEVAELISVTDSDLLEEIFDAAKSIKERVYGNRLVLFAPLYVSNHCSNECRYCAFSIANRALKRKALTLSEIEQETKLLIDSGQKRVLLVSGEPASSKYFKFILDAIDTVYATSTSKGKIRRINANISPLTFAEFSELKKRALGTYQLFQESYHLPTYRFMHKSGPKADYRRRITAIDEAMRAGIDDIGMGVLFGLYYDWRFELLALLQHAEYLESEFGVGPHTISVPRLEPAFGYDWTNNPPAAVSNEDFKKIIAILRLAVPYTGIILSTRETPLLRRIALKLGVSQISAGSRTNPGGYDSDAAFDASQFSVGDHRPLDEIIADVASLGYIPSFCTACYRLGRTGHDFMNIAKPGEIKNFCLPNALVSFQEYLEGHASPETYAIGSELIEKELRKISSKERALTEEMIKQIKGGKKDIFL